MGLALFCVTAFILTPIAFVSYLRVVLLEPKRFVGLLLSFLLGSVAAFPLLFAISLSIVNEYVEQSGKSLGDMGFLPVLIWVIIYAGDAGVLVGFIWRWREIKKKQEN